ncbi:hypothetical protein V8F20_008885 [Naviculisporaceae sp. PSN 640]
MALRSLSTLLLATLASSSPVPSTSSYPTTLPVSKSYRLYINLTNPALDSPENPLNGQYLTAVRAGATINAPTITNSSASGAKFSTTNRQTTQISSTFSSTFGPYSIVLAGSDSESSEDAPSSASDSGIIDFGINVSKGTEGVYPSENTCTRLATPKVGTFAVCDQVFDAYAHPRWLVVFAEGVGGDELVPDQQGRLCVPVNLVPECDSYEPVGGEDEIVPQRCWSDVGAVQNWEDYGC